MLSDLGRNFACSYQDQASWFLGASPFATELGHFFGAHMLFEGDFMIRKNRIDLENNLYIYQRSDVQNADRWYCSVKPQGVKRKYIPLGVMDESEAKKLARRELTRAEKLVEEFGETAYLSKNTIGAAYKFFKDEGLDHVKSEGRYRVIMSAWDTHLLEFFGRKTKINRKLQKTMLEYPEFRRRWKNKREKIRFRYAKSTLRNNIMDAQQLLNVAREHAGIGEEIGDLNLKLKKTKILEPGKSKTVAFTDSEIVKIKAGFDSDAKAKLKKIDLPNQKNFAPVGQYQMFQLERLRFLVALAFASGCRLGELRHIRHGDIAPDFKTVFIRESKTVNAKNRHAYIDNDIWDIEEAWKRFLPYCATVGKTGKPVRGGLIFKNKVDITGAYNIRTKQGEMPIGRGGDGWKRFLVKHDLLMGTGEDPMPGDHRRVRKYARGFFSIRHYWIETQIGKGVSAYAVATSSGTSLSQIERTYFRGSKTTIANMFEGDQGADKHRARKQSHLKMVK